METFTDTRFCYAACFTLPRASTFVQWLVDLWRDKGVEIRQVTPDAVQLVLAEAGMVSLQLQGTRSINCRVDAISADMGERLQLSLIEFLGEFADNMGWPDGSWGIAWDGQAPRSPAQLQVLHVQSNRAISPRMRRLRLHGDLGNFANGGLHVRMLLPPCEADTGVAPAWPTLQDDGRLQWPPGQARMARRTYTIRDIDVDAAWMDIDVLLHPSGGGADGEPVDAPGSDWAAQARPGNLVGMLSPGSGVLPIAQRYVMVADACALPAAARMLQNLTCGASTALLLWVAQDDERSAFDVPVSRVQPHWICSGEPGASAPEITQVLAWLDQQNWPGSDTVLWVAGGLPLTQAVRRWVAETPVLGKVRKMVHTYWR